MNVLIDSFLILILAVATYTDVRRGKVYNALTFPAIGLGLAINGLFGGFDGLSESIRAGLLALAMLIVPVALRAVGAGDLKLLAAVGTLEGSKFLFLVFVYSALVLGAAAAVIISYRRLATVAFPMQAESGLGKIKVLPYAVAISIGCVVALYGR